MSTAFIYIGRTFLNCGPSKGQQTALSADSTFRSTLNSSYNTDFADSQEVFNDLNNNIEQIVAKGESQEGMSPEEKAAENSQALNSAAAANKNVQQLIGQKAAMTGASPGVESGVTQAVRAASATSIENNLANKQTDIVEKDYDIGRQNYQNAVKEEEALPNATIDPTNGAANATTGAEKVAGDQADQNAAASSSWMGLVGGLADSAVKGFAGPASRAIFGSGKNNSQNS